MDSGVSTMSIDLPCPAATTAGSSEEGASSSSPPALTEQNKRMRTNSSSLETTEAQLKASLQNIFLVRVPGAAESARTPPPSGSGPTASASEKDERKLFPLEMSLDLLRDKESPWPLVDFSELCADILMEVLTASTLPDGAHPPGVSKKATADLQDAMLAYTVMCYTRAEEEARACKKRAQGRTAGGGRSKGLGEIGTVRRDIRVCGYCSGYETFLYFSFYIGLFKRSFQQVTFSDMSVVTKLL